MGQAKQKKQRIEQAKKLSAPMKRSRFNLYTMGTRHSKTIQISKELSWWGTADDALIGMVALDTIDQDYLWMVLARDKIGRFRCASLKTDYTTQTHAENALHVEMARVLETNEIDEFGIQGDETNHPMDPFHIAPDQDAEKLHPYFKLLLEDEGRAPGRKVLRELALWLAPKDPHLVKEFQTSGFDQRLWEFFLWAAFREFSLDVDQLEAPDFRCRAPGIDFTVEATTVGPSVNGVLAEHPNPETPEEKEAFLRDYMPMKFGSALTGKLNKENSKGLHYWEREESNDKPFVIAIADFHKPANEDELGPMTYTQSALWQYLYGNRVSWKFEGDRLIMNTEKIEIHEFKGKVIPSGFFDLPKAENISAVVFSNAGTISKFDRMGAVAGFQAEKHGYFRVGLKANPDPNAVMGLPFSEDVLSDDYEEFWTQEIQVFHNPNAKIPLPFESLMGASHHYFENGELRSIMPDDAILSSFTMLMKYVS